MKKIYDCLCFFYSLFPRAPKKRTEADKKEQAKGLVARIMLAGDHSCHMEPSEFSDSMKLARGQYLTREDVDKMRKRVLAYKFPF